VFVDAAERSRKTWYLERFMTLRETAFQDERSYFRMVAACPSTTPATGLAGLGHHQRPEPA
jgi:pantothenate kinase